MLKFARRAALVLVAALIVLLLVPRETAPRTGAWLTRAGLEARTVRVGAFDVRYVRAGAGPPLVLIHGLASSIYTWADVIGPLSTAFDVIALDLPGFGGSSQPPTLTFDAYPGVVLGLMDALGIEKAHVAGNSMGGAVSLVLAASAPGRVDRLVILDSAGFNMGQGERPFIIQLLASKSVGFVAERLPLRRFLTRMTLRQLIPDRSRVTDERIDEYVGPMLRPGALDSVRSLLLSRVDLGFESQMAQIQAPTLVVWGRFDPWLPVAQADRFVEVIKTARKVVLETGHMPQEEQPAEVARLMREFLTQ